MNQALFPYNYIPYDDKGRPVFNGSLYFGVPNLDPEIPANQIDVYGQQEDGSTVLLSQPISTGAGGIPMFGGSPVSLLIEETYYSFKALDSYDAQIYYAASLVPYCPDITSRPPCCSVPAILPSSPVVPAVKADHAASAAPIG